MVPRRAWLLGSLVLSASLALASAAPAGAEENTAPTLLSSVTVPGKPLDRFDISFVDPRSQLYYLGDRSNAQVDVINARTGKYVGAIGAGLFVGFTGNNNTSGPDGVLVAGDQLWAGDGDSTVKVFNVHTGKLLATIPSGGKFRVDEMVYDPEDHLVVTANNADAPPFETFFSTRTLKVVGHLQFPRATNGAEQPVWDQATERILQNIPELDGNHATGEVAVVDPVKMTQVGSFPVSQCEPGGLELGRDQKLLVSCSNDALLAGFPAKTLILDARSGRVLHTITQVGGGDEAGYDSRLGRFYVSGYHNPGGPVLGVIDAREGEWIANLPTAASAHSVAANAANGWVFVPLNSGATQCATPSQGCVAIYGIPDQDRGDR